MAERRQPASDPISAALDPPDALVGLLLALTVIHIGMEIAPAGWRRAVWSAVELSPMRLNAAVDHGRNIIGASTRLIGHLLFHVNVPHLLVNLLGTFAPGAYLLHLFSARTSPRASDRAVAFLLLFILSGLFAGLAFVAADPAAYRGMIGPSGSVAGLWGAAVHAFAMNHEQQRRIAIAKMALFSALLLGAGVLLDLSAISRWLYGSHAAWQAHVGGYLFGIATYPLIARIAGAETDNLHR